MSFSSASWFFSMYVHVCLHTCMYDVKGILDVIADQLTMTVEYSTRKLHLNVCSAACM